MEDKLEVEDFIRQLIFIPGHELSLLFRFSLFQMFQPRLLSFLSSGSNWRKKERKNKQKKSNPCLKFDLIAFPRDQNSGL